jgi:aspartate carbamoyltransferase catalytic subunit
MIKDFYPKNIIKTQDFDIRFLFDFLDRTKKIKKHYVTPLGRRRLAATFAEKNILNIFEEPSTRTMMSFESAIKALGGNYKTLSDPKTSSLYKGESIEDMIRVVTGYQTYDAIVIRSRKEGIVERAANVSPVPVISAGDGSGQHPTQSLLDLFTIYEKKPELNNLTVTLSGDLKFGRTTHSLPYILSKVARNIHFIFASPKGLEMKKGILEYLSEPNVSGRGISYEETNNLEDALKVSDVVYVTRVQVERFPGKTEEEKKKQYLELASRFVIYSKNIKLMKSNALLMHPLPIAGPTDEKPYLFSEITDTVKKDARFIAFNQSDNGKYARMALLEMMLLTPEEVNGVF